MFNLDELYSGHRTHGDNSLCEGCSLLEKKKPCHSVMDYEEISPSPVLFLSDSLNYSMGSTTAFSNPELKLIRESYTEEFVTSAAVKCPSVREADMSPSNMVICRAHLEATIDKIQPKVIFPCGNLAMKMLLRKSGITTKRGKSFQYETLKGHSCTVVPLYHPYTCIREPRHITLFKKDIQNAYQKYILCKEDKSNFSYSVLMTSEEASKALMPLEQSSETLAIDIETTGLNFLKDDIMTISFSSHERTIVLPLNHKDSPFRKGEPDHAKIWDLLRKVLENPRNKKIFHNAKFDLKFLINHGIYTKNVWDTKIMHHLIDENMPKSLMDLAKLYFSGELESL